jgi:hypothetical protein
VCSSPALLLAPFMHRKNRVFDHDQGEGRGYNVSDPQMPFCPDPEEVGARPPGDSLGNLQARLRGPHACELRELDIARGIARRLRSELIYGMPAEAQVYEESNVPTSRNLPLFMEFVFEILTGSKDPGPQYE